MLAGLRIPKITAIYYDLGVSSVHFDEGARGFSFRDTGTLDMRYDRHSEILSARDIVNTYDRSDLVKIFRMYGAEPKATFIADALIARRSERPIETTEELSHIIQTSSFDPKSRVRVFQALRIETNDEYGAIEESLHAAVAHLADAGRCLVITFHSGEDRLVKHIFQTYLTPESDPFTGRTTRPAILTKVHKKPLIPTPDEINANPRSRSAKMRIVEKSPLH